MVRLLRVKEVFNFGHIEFSNSNKLVSGSNFISESQTDLGGSKRNFTVIIVKQSVEVNKHTLSCFGSKVTCEVTTGSNTSFKHHVEGNSRSKGVSFFTNDFKFLVSLSKLFLGIRFSVLNEFFKFCF